MNLPRLNKGSRRRYLARLILNGVAQTITIIAMALLMRSAFDQLVMSRQPAETGTLIRYLAAFAGVVIIRALLRWRERVDSENLGQDYVYEVRQQLFAHMSSLSPRILQRRSRGGTMLRFVGDLTALRQWISLGVARLAVAAVATVGTLAALAAINPHIVALVGGLLLLASLAMLLLGRELEQAARDARRRRSRLAANVSEKIAAMAVVQAFGQRAREQRRLRKQSHRLRLAMLYRSHRIGQLRAVVEAVVGFASTGVVVLGAWEITRGAATPGAVVAAMMVVGILSHPLRDLGRVYEYWRGARVSKEKIMRFLNTSGSVSERRDAGRLVVANGGIEFRNVGLDGVIRGFSQSAAAGERVALIGPNGAGKSTLLAMAAGLFEPDQGQILIDGRNIADCSLQSVRANVGVMGPDLPLLRGSIERNLKYRLPSASQQQLDAVCQLCEIDELARTLPKGLRTRVTDGALNLSAGQRARLMLARAMLGAPPVLLLDEADANLDPVAVGIVERVLDTYPGTILLVTHRKNLLTRMNQVWELQPLSLARARQKERIPISRNRRPNLALVG